MNILVTGAFGFIGARCCERLLAQGHDVIMASRSEKNRDILLQGSEFKHFDLNDRPSIRNACKNVDIIVHAAGMNAQKCSKSLEKSIIINGLGTEMVAEEAINAGVQKIIFLSTAHVYRSPLVGLIDERTELTNKHPYAVSNSVGEKYLIDLVKKSNLEATVLRISNCVGAPLFFNTDWLSLVVNDFCLQALEKSKIVINSNGSAQRNFVCIKDVASVIGYFCRNEVPNRNEIIFNLAGQKSFSLREVAALVSERTRALFRNSRIVVEEKQATDSQNPKENDLIFSTEKLASLGLICDRPLGDSIDECLKYLVSLRGSR